MANNIGEKIMKLEAEVRFIKENVDKLESDMTDLKKEFLESEKKVSSSINKLIIELNGIKSELRIYSKIPTGILVILSIINMIVSILLNLRNLG